VGEPFHGLGGVGVRVHLGEVEHAARDDSGEPALLHRGQPADLGRLGGTVLVAVVGQGRAADRAGRGHQALRVGSEPVDRRAFGECRAVDPEAGETLHGDQSLQVAALVARVGPGEQRGDLGVDVVVGVERELVGVEEDDAVPREVRPAPPDPVPGDAGGRAPSARQRLHQVPVVVRTIGPLVLDRYDATPHLEQRCRGKVAGHRVGRDRPSVRLGPQDVQDVGAVDAGSHGDVHGVEVAVVAQRSLESRHRIGDALMIPHDSYDPHP
jgi:hypothetical protein